MRIVFDIDGTICTQETDYRNAKPIYEVINKVNSHYEQGDYIILQTARGTMTGVRWEEITKKQLDDWGVLYHELQFGKSAGDLYVDDKACNVLNYEPTIQGEPTEKVWGTEYLLCVNDKYAMKRLEIKPSKKISLQYHENKHETWHIVDGYGYVLLDKHGYEVHVGDTVEIPAKTVHQIMAGIKGIVIIESSTPELDDIVRLGV